MSFRNVFSVLHMPNTAFTAHRQNVKVPLEDVILIGISDSNIIHFGPFEIVFFSSLVVPSTVPWHSGGGGGFKPLSP